MNGIHENNLQKLNVSNEVLKNQFTNKENNKKKKHGNKFDVKDTGRSDVPTKYSKDDKKTSEVFRKVQINTDGKVKRRIKNNDKLEKV